ncbi:MAG: DUF2807 domain-containing protein [Acidobacteriota bacterium]
MKRLVLLIVMMALGAGCHIHHKVAGSGNLKKETRNVGSFTSISTEGAFNIKIVCQKMPAVDIEGDDNILPLITTQILNNVLHISTLRSYDTAAPVTLEITVQNLQGIHSAGAGTIDISGLKNERFEIIANGAPTVKVFGETRVLTIDASGAGNIDAHKLRAARVEVGAKGVAEVEVYASEQLDAVVSGPSHVIYSGNAAVNKTVNGPGSVEKKEAEVN